MPKTIAGDQRGKFLNLKCDTLSIIFVSRGKEIYFCKFQVSVYSHFFKHNINLQE